MKMVLDYSFEEIGIPLNVDSKTCMRSSIFGTKGEVCCSDLSARLICFCCGMRNRLFSIGNACDCNSIFWDIPRDLES